MSGSFQQTSDTARETLQAATIAIQQLKIDTTRTLANIDQLVTTSQTQIVAIGKDVQRVVNITGRTMSQAEQVIASINQLAGPRSPARDDIEITLRDLAASASSLRNFTQELERNPGAALLGRSSR